MIKVDKTFLKNLSNKARSVTRKRTNFDFHGQLEDPLQRMLNAIEPGTYIRPHKHVNPDKREAFVVLTGRFAVIEFDESGNVSDHVILDATAGNYIAEIELRQYHSILSLAPGTVAYEIKDGPYVPEEDKIFAHWAPAEKDPDSAIYLQSLIKKLGLK